MFKPRERSICPPGEEGEEAKKASPGAGGHWRWTVAGSSGWTGVWSISKAGGVEEGMLRTVVPGETRESGQMGTMLRNEAIITDKSKHAEKHSNVVLMKKIQLSTNYLRCHHYCGWLLGFHGRVLRSHTRSRILPSES